MKNRLQKTGILFLLLCLALMALSACGKTAAENPPASEPAVTASSVTLVADGREITLEDAAGKTLQQLLDRARITLQEDDLLVLAPEETLDDTLTVYVMSGMAAEEPTEPEPTEPEPTEPAPTEPEVTEPEPSQGEKTVVSTEVYYDCDSSGHGVKIITYSDGTQEEVYF